MKAVSLFFGKQLLMLHCGTILLKMKSLVFLSLPLSVIAWFANHVMNWTISNAEYITGVCICIAIDYVVGSYYHAFTKKDYTLKKNLIGLTLKIALTAAGGILFEVIHLTVRETPLIYEYLKVLTRLLVVLYPAGSAMMNMSAITNGRFPPIGWIKKLKAFNEDMDLDKFKKNTNQNEIS